MTKTLIAAAALAFLAACTTTSPDVVQRGDAQRLASVQDATVLSVRNVVVDGTQSGAGFTLGLERRYLNSRGHKALAQLDYANKRKTATVQYRVPAFAWLDGWFTASLQAADEQTDALDSRRVEFVASRSGQYNDRLNGSFGAGVLLLLPLCVFIVAISWDYVAASWAAPSGTRLR